MLKVTLYTHIYILQISHYFLKSLLLILILISKKNIETQNIFL